MNAIRPLLLAAALLVAWCVLATMRAADNPSPVALPVPTVDLPPAHAGEVRTAVFAAGCFWCVEGFFAELTGVRDVVSGYAGDGPETAHYDRIHGSNHAEVVRISYDPAVISYAELLRILFTISDPTVKDGQAPDYGRQYRVAVFAADADQRRVAEAYIAQLTAAKAFAKPIVATVEDFPQGFFPAEDYHQDFVANNPRNPYVCRWSLEKIARVRALFPQDVKPEGAAAGK